jgi:hypothetical protein
VRLTLVTRHRTLVILTGDDARTDYDDEEPAASATGGQFDPAPLVPPPFGFHREGDFEERLNRRS